MTHFTPSTNPPTRCQAIRRLGLDVLERSIHVKTTLGERILVSVLSCADERTERTARDAAGV
jgi:hypothetical protein